jgi:GcrA cell cycle regulator
MLMAAFPRQPPAEDIPIYNGCGCTLLELSQGKCRWPISNPGAEDFCFCGNEPVKGLPYCLGHVDRSRSFTGRLTPARASHCDGGMSVGGACGEYPDHGVTRCRVQELDLGGAPANGERCSGDDLTRCQQPGAFIAIRASP